MKKFIVTIICLFLLIPFLLAQQLEVTGIYQGENVYVMNPFATDGVGFCVTEITVNSENTTDEIASSAFEIDLGGYGLKLGDPVKILIKYKDNCLPQVLNPEVLMPQSSFNVEKINLTKYGNLTWSTSGELGSLPFYVEQFKWNKWVKISTIPGKGTPGINNYSTNIIFTTGLNKIRIRQIDHSKKTRTSKIIEYNNPKPAIKFSLDNIKKPKKLIFSAKNNYEIYNYYGQIVKKGYSSTADISTLARGTYFLNYDNKTETFEKR